VNDSPPSLFEGSHAPPEVRQTASGMLPAFYADLRRVARRERLRFGGTPETLQTTALVHEAFLRLRQSPAFNDPAHFLRAAALAMRHALINTVRDRMTQKRGEGVSAVPLEEAADVAEVEVEERLLAVHDALTRLGDLDERLEQIVECRFFAGYSVEETAQALGLSERTVHREWIKARAWLQQELKSAAS
jgi:RNA polymerase sigma factor (TIGR02999 family)